MNTVYLSSSVKSNTINIAPFQYIRFTFSASRVAGIQIQKIYFYSNLNKLDCSTAAATSTPNVVDIQHPASNLINNNLTSKYYYASSLSLPVVVWIKFTSPLAITKYSFVSGNDVPDRDPKSWTVEVSSDNVNWRRVHNIQNYIMFSSRVNETSPFLLFYI
jgi:hypothetical protein